MKSTFPVDEPEKYLYNKGETRRLPGGPARGSGKIETRRNKTMADRQDSPRSDRPARPAPTRRDVIRCEKCGEDYSVTYKRCPFCDERPGRGGIAGRRVSNTRGGGYGGPVNPIQIMWLIISVILIIAALYIILTKLGPLFHRGDPSASGSAPGTSQSTNLGPQPSVSSPGSSQPGSSAPAASGTTPDPAAVRPEAISLSKQDFTLSANASWRITAAVSPAGVTDPVLWSSSDESVATVDAEGNVTNVNAGSERKSVTITASCGDVTASCIVRCSPGSSAPTTPAGTPGGPMTAGSTGTVDADTGLKVRSGPGSSYDKVASLPDGAKITVLEVADGWYKVEYKPGETGYISADYVIPD